VARIPSVAISPLGSSVSNNWGLWESSGKMSRDHYTIIETIYIVTITSRNNKQSGKILGLVPLMAQL
jgi:hypothetical protein